MRLRCAPPRGRTGVPHHRIPGVLGLPFSLSPHTLDPRPDRASCGGRARLCLRGGLTKQETRVSTLARAPAVLLGALLSELPLSTGVHVDLDQEALCTARGKFRRFGVVFNRASFLCGGWARALGDESFDIIVSNPPLIFGSSEIAGLEAEVQAFDPRLALDGGKDGLEAFRMILVDAFRVLGAKSLVISKPVTGKRK